MGLEDLVHDLRTHHRQNHTLRVQAQKHRQTRRVCLTLRASTQAERHRLDSAAAQRRRPALRADKLKSTGKTVFWHQSL